MDRARMRQMAGRDPVGKVYHVDMPDDSPPKKKPDSLSGDTLYAISEIQDTVKRMAKFARSRNLHLARREIGRAVSQLGFVAKANGWEKEAAPLLKVGKHMMRG